MYVITYTEVDIPTLNACGTYQGVSGGLLETKQFETKEKAIKRIKRQVRIEKTHWANNLQGKEQGYEVSVQVWEKEITEVIVSLWHSGKIENQQIYLVQELK